MVEEQVPAVLGGFDGDAAKGRVRQEHQLSGIGDRQAAQQDGILKTAQDNARSALVTILKGLGFERVEFS